MGIGERERASAGSFRAFGALPRGVVASCVAAMAGTMTSAQDAFVARVTDAAAPVPGELIVSPLQGEWRAGAPDGESPPQMPGWPKTTGRHVNFVPSRGAALHDLDGDDDLEVIVVATNGFIHAWHHTGSTVAGFPISGMIGFPQYPPSIADLDDDGDVEIVQTTRGFTDGGRLYAFSHTGAVLPGFPKNFGNNNIEYCPALVDLDADGTLEIIVHERAWPSGNVRILDHDGAEWTTGWPFAMDHVPTVTAAVGDVDGDGDLEIVTASYNSMYVLNTDGSLLPGWPKQIAGSNFSYQSPALADLDGDGDLEVVIGTHMSTAGCYVFHHTGAAVAGWPRTFGTWSYGAPTVTDLEGDGAFEIIDGRAGGFSGFSSCFWVWNAAGQTRAGFPYASPTNFGGGSEGPYTAADIDGDGVLELFADHNVMESNQGFLFGVDASGDNLPGFPVRTNGFTYINGATIGDVDGDGDAELACLSFHDNGVDVNLYDLPAATSPTSRDWPTYHLANARAGWFGAPGDEEGTTLTGVSAAVGQITSGGLAEIESSDDDRLVARSGFGATFIDLHHLDLRVAASTTVTNPSLIDLAVESRIDQPAGTLQLRLRNWTTDQFTTVGSFAIGATETTRTVNDIAAANFIDGDGAIELSIKPIVFVPIFAFRFDTFVDHVGITVE